LACRFSVVNAGRPRKDAVAAVVGALKGTSAIAAARRFGSRTHNCNGETFWARGGTVVTVGGEEEQRRVISPPRSSSIPKAGMQMVTVQSRWACSSGSPWGCSLPSSLPLCGSVMTARSAPLWHAPCVIDYRLDDGLHVPSLHPPSTRFLPASGAGGASKACFQTGAHASGVCHHCCRRLPRDYARKRAQRTTVLTAFDNPMLLSSLNF
jgi:hypothetical protein